MQAPQRIGLALCGLLLPPLSLCHAQTIAADPPAEGSREFWVVFQKNFRDVVVNGMSQQSHAADPLELRLAITAERDAHGYVEIPGLGSRIEFTVRAGKLVIVPIDSAAQLRTSGIVEKLGVHVVTDAPVMIYGSDRRFQTTDTYLAYPVELLGRSYRAVCYRWLQNDLLAQVAIVATEDGTRVKIMPTAPVAKSSPSPRPAAPVTPPVIEQIKIPRPIGPKKPGRSISIVERDAASVIVSPVQVRRLSKTKAPAMIPVAEGPSQMSAPQEVATTAPFNDTPMLPEPKESNPSARTTAAPAGGAEPIEITLNRGEAYQIIAKYDPAGSSDLTGTLIESDRPIAVFSGHNCAYVPNSSIKACNLLIEQMPPVSTWGREHYVGMLAGRSGAVVRVVASEDDTHIMENGREVATLVAGGYYENSDQRAPLVIVADRPVLVTQFSRGFDDGDNVGDPMMIVVAPVTQYNSSYRFATPMKGPWRNFVNVMAPSASLGELRIDGNQVDRSLFRSIGDGPWSYGAVEVGQGAHLITGSVPFGLYSYGFGYNAAVYDAYGNAGGYMTGQSAR